MMVHLIRNLLILIVITNVVKAEVVEKILFSINDKIYTTIDLNNRINYIKLMSNKDDQLNNENFLKDFISILLYNEYARENKLNVNKKILKNYFDDILLNNKKKSSNIQISDEELLENIRYDYQKKLIIESLLANKKNEILRVENEILDIYNIKFDYFTFNNEVDNILDKIIELIDFNNIDLTKTNLKKNLIDFVYLSYAINSLKNIDASIKKEIFNNKEKFILKEDDFVLVGKITKELKKNIDLKITFYKINFDKEINNEIITCNNLKTFKDANIEKFDKIQISKLNDLIIDNLISINDKILIKKDNFKYYLILCELNYNPKSSKEVIINNKIDDEILKIENSFLFEQKIKYNFKLYE